MYNAPYYLFVCAAGNSRNDGLNTGDNGYDLLTGHALSKNGVTVAAVGEVLNYNGAASVVMSDFSNWGPTDDGRIKPDISAKGVNTYSAVDDNNTSYSFLNGTSMASPSVTGTLLLLQQYYNQVNENYMRSATLRGLMIHTADEAGNANGPDYEFGWGLINAEKSANIITNNGATTLINELNLVNNETYNLSLEASGTEPLIATICWTDPEGVIGSQAEDDSTPLLVNDLDIRITQGNQTYYPWKLNVANPSSAATTGDNTVDNVEKIEIPNANGVYEISVFHKGTLMNSNQNYSIIISGIAENEFRFNVQDPDSTNACITQNTLDIDFDFFRVEDFNQAVNLSVQNVPNELSVNISPSTINQEQNFTLEFTGISALSPGSYNMTVQGVAGDITYEYPLTINVYNNIQDPITLNSPSNNQTSLELPITFEWEENENVTDYTIQISEDENFLNITEEQVTDQNSYVSNNLISGTEYYWRVLAENACGESDLFNMYSFITSCETNVSLELNTATSSTLSLNIFDENSDSWEIEYVESGMDATGVGEIFQDTNPLFQNLESSTCYDFYIRNNCDVGLSDWSDPVTFCTTPDYCAGDHFYDSGGPDGNYQNEENWTETITPENEGDRIVANFLSFQLENCCDFLVIYNGPDDSYPILYFGNGNNSPGIVESTDSTESLTFKFTSDSSVTESGWEAEIMCASLSVENPDDKNAFTFYPNPVDEFLNINSESKIKSYKIYDFSAKLISFVSDVNQKSLEIDFRKMKEGTYFVQLEFNAKQTEVIKILKN